MTNQFIYSIILMVPANYLIREVNRVAKNRGKGTHMFFSKEHTSRSNPKPHTDSFRQVGSNKATKTGHNFNSPGYGNKSVSIPIGKR